MDRPLRATIQPLMAPKQFLNAMTLAALLLLTTAAHADPDAATAPATPSPEEANSTLVAGNERFVQSAATHPRQSTKRASETATGEHPFVTVLSCSDSRVPPELLFDQGLGDVFSVRVPGNVVNGDELASVEYGVDHLGTPLLVVMGHTRCGAVTAIAKHAVVPGHLPALFAKIGTAVEAAHAKLPHGSDGEIVAEAVRANVFESMATVLRESDLVRERIDSGKTRMIGGIYDLTTGGVTWLGPHPDQKQLIAKARTSEPAAHGHDPPKDEHGEAAKHGDDAGAGHDPPDEAHAATDSHAPAPLPLPLPPNPISFAVLALICTFGGGISGRLSAK